MAPPKLTAKISLEDLGALVIEKTFDIQLPKPQEHPVVRSAQRYLNAARDSVSLVNLNMRLVREFAKAIDNKDSRGRLQNSEMDLLRASVVFAGAGLDAVLKELIRKAIPVVVPNNALAEEKFARFVAEHLGSLRSAIDLQALALVLIGPVGPREVLLSRYADELTGGSLQSVTQVSNVAGVLGVTDPALRKRLTAGSLLDNMFRARNQIVHELDLTSSGIRSRTIKDAKAWAEEALSVGQEMINAVARNCPQAKS